MRCAVFIICVVILAAAIYLLACGIEKAVKGQCCWGCAGCAQLKNCGVAEKEMKKEKRARLNTKTMQKIANKKKASLK